MGIDPQQQARNKLQEINTNFLSQLPAQIDQLSQFFALITRQGWDPNEAQKILFSAHRLVGISLSLGFEQFGYQVRNLETLIKNAEEQWSDSPEAVTAWLLRLEQQIDRVKEAGRSLLNTHRTSQSLPVVETFTSVQSMQDTRSRRLVYLVEDDLDQAEDLATQIGYFGYTPRVLTNLADLQQALNTTIPDAIISDVIFPEGDTAGPEAIQNLHDSIPDDLPVIYISVRDDLVSRLQSVRSCGSAYFVKPVDIGELVDTLDRLLAKHDTIPYRILIIDDSSIQANINAMHLKKSGMETTIITQPMEVLVPLIHFNPDLILLDIYMPECSGLELAKTIRQIPAFVSIPIVFLSAETDRDIQLEAVSLGGDDFLTKPIKPAHLVASVTSRVERYRQLRSLMLHDSLTGLLNHSALKERLAQEINRSARHNAVLSYAMLDLDLFKRINDTYGHASGDRVLRSLSQMLTKRLRRTDIVGRYGGEEFGVIFPNTTLQHAAATMEQLRDSFSKIHHRAGDSEFTVTFSCGIASFPEYLTPAAISENADRALYQAKNMGRNRVVAVS